MLFFFAFIVTLVLFKFKVLSVISVLVGYIFCDTLILACEILSFQ